MEKLRILSKNYTVMKLLTIFTAIMAVRAQNSTDNVNVTTAATIPSSAMAATTASTTVSKVGITSGNKTGTAQDSAPAAATVNHRFQTKAKPSSSPFAEAFSKCKRRSPDFDKCAKDAINKVASYIPTGVEEFGIPAFDPIFAKEVLLKRGGDNFGYRLRLRNVEESGWRFSKVTRFKSNLKLNTVQITQYFPDKHLKGEYEFDSLFLQPNHNRGIFNMSLYDLNQTTTLSRPKNSKSIRVHVNVQEIGNMKLHISNLLRGRTRLENVLDRMINSAFWRPGFTVVRPFVNELVSNAFVDIYNGVFNDFDFDKLLPP